MSGNGEHKRIEVVIPSPDDMLAMLVNRNDAMKKKIAELRELENPSQTLQALTLLLESQVLLSTVAIGNMVGSRPKRSGLVLPTAVTPPPSLIRKL